MGEYLDLTFQIASEPEPQPAQVRLGLLVHDLILEITREFDISEPDSYELYREKQLKKPLARTQSLVRQRVQSGDTLVFMRPALMRRKPIHSPQKASLKLKGSRKQFLIQWQPAIIGRPDADPIYSGLLAVNLGWHPENRRISRRHAQITEEAGIFFVETLTANNSTFLNNERLIVNERYPLKHGDKIILRNSKVILQFSLQK